MVKETSIKTTTTANKYFKSDIEKNNFNSNSDLYDFIYNSVNSLLTIEKQTISARSNNFLSLLLSHILNNLENRISEKNTKLKIDKDSNKNKFENEISEKVSKIIYEKINKKESSEKIEGVENKFTISSENISKEILEIFNSDEFKDEITNCINDNVEKHSKETLDIFKNNFENSVLENTSEFKEEISKKLSEEEKYIKNIEKFISTISKLFQKKSNIVFNKNQIYGFEKNNSENLNSRLSKSNEIISTLENAKDNVKNQIDLTNKKLKKSDIVSNTSDINQISKKNLDKKFKTNSKSFLGFLPNLSKKVKEKNSNVNNSEKYLKKSFLGKSLHIPFKNFNKKNKKFFKDQEKKKTSFIGNLFTSIVKNKVFIFWSTVFITFLFRKLISAYNYIEDNFSDKESAKDWFNRQKEKILQIPLIKGIFEDFCRFKTNFDGHDTVKLLNWLIKNWGWLHYALLAGSILKTALDCGLGDILKKRFMDIFKKTRLWKSTSRFFTHLRWRIRDVIRKSWKKIFDKIFKPFIDEVGEFFTKRWGNISEILEKFRLKNIREAISDAIDKVWSPIKSAFSEIREKFTKLSINGIKESIVNWFRRQKTSLIENSKRIVDDIVEKLKLGPIIDKLTDIKNSLKLFAQALKNNPKTFIKQLFLNGFKNVKTIAENIFKFSKTGIIKAVESYSLKKIANKAIKEFVETGTEEISEKTLKKTVEKALKDSGKKFTDEQLETLTKNGTKRYLTKTAVGTAKAAYTSKRAALLAKLAKFGAPDPSDIFLLAGDLAFTSALNEGSFFYNDLDYYVEEDQLKRITAMNNQISHVLDSDFLSRFPLLIPDYLTIRDIYNSNTDEIRKKIEKNRGHTYNENALKLAKESLDNLIYFSTNYIFKDKQNDELFPLFKGFEDEFTKIIFQEAFPGKRKIISTEKYIDIFLGNIKSMLYLKSILENKYKIMHPELYNHFINPNSEIFKQVIKNYSEHFIKEIVFGNTRIGFSSNFIYEILDAFTYVPRNPSEIKKTDIISVELSKILPQGVPLEIKTDSSDYYITFNSPSCTMAVELNNKDYFRNIFNVYKTYGKHGYFNEVDTEKGLFDVVLTNPGRFIGHRENIGYYDDTISMSPRLKSHGIFFKNGSEYTNKFTFNTFANNPPINLTNYSLAINRKNLEKELTMHFKNFEIKLDDNNSIDNAIKSLKDDFKIDENDLNSPNFNAFYHALLIKFMEAAKEMN